MRNLLALLLALLFCFSCVTSYAEGSRETSPQESVLKNGDYEYVVDEDGNAKLLSYSWDSHKDGGDVIIPSVIDGHSVKTIGTHCFAPDTNVEVGSFVIPDTVSIIEQQAIYKLKINNIMLPQDVAEIAHGAIVANYRTISLARDNSNYTVVENALYEKSTKTLLAMPHSGSKILEGIQVIGAYACYDIEPEETELDIPTSVETIEEYAFFSAKLFFSKRQSSFYIPATSIGAHAFDYCQFWGKQIESISFSFNDELRIIPENCFYKASTREYEVKKQWNKTYFRYINAEVDFNCTCKITFPKNLERIENSAFLRFGYSFRGDPGIIEICSGFPDGLISLGEHCFESSGKVVIQTENGFEKNNKLTSIGAYAFFNTTLTTISDNKSKMNYIIPRTVTEIGECALNIQTENEQYVVQLFETIQQIGDDAFDKSKVHLVVEPDSYVEKWAIRNAFSYETNQEDDLSWLD